MSNENNKDLVFTLDFDAIKFSSPENFLALMKYIQNFGEESFTFIKIMIHLYQLKNNNPHFDGKVILKILSPDEIFLIESSSKLKVNSYVQLYGRINQISTLKKIHTKINFVCSNCGIIGSRNIAFVDIKSGLSNHICPEQSFPSKITKEFTNPIYLRELSLEFNNEVILCMISESLFNVKLLTGQVKISGIVKTRNESNKSENLFIKYINIISIDSFHVQPYTTLNNETMFQLENFAKIKNKFAFCYNKLLHKVDYNNLLFFYYMFSLSKNIHKANDDNLRIHLINLTKNELSNYTHIKRINALFPNMFTFLSNDSSTCKQDGLYTNRNPYENKRPSYVNYNSNHFIINNYDSKNDAIKSQLNSMNIMFSSFNSSSSNVNSLIQSSNSREPYSLITIAKSFDIIPNDYDIISITSDINDSSNDRKKSNQIIANQFIHHKKKRTYQEAMETQINQVDKINTSNFIEDLYSIDSMSLVDYFKNEICIEENETLDEFNFNQKFIGIFITFVNEYIHPVIPEVFYKDFYYLSEHLKHQFQDLNNCGMFDINWITVKTLAKVARLSARIEMREEVQRDDILKAYFITKEFLQQNYVVCLLSRKEKLKGNKAKLCYIIEKLRQFAQTNGRKISIVDIKSFGQFSDAEYSLLIEKLNYEGVLLKLNSQQYQIVN